MLRRKNRSRPVGFSILSVAALAAAAPALGESLCSVLDENTFVRDTLRDIYLRYSELPDLCSGVATASNTIAAQ